ncbi:storkhead-box protein 1-like [Falco rusticolus]|uniref:storkhead-box protein 1-like n=1 Tax=Falco rusticolus TaxID=120794 RepID=UPI0018868FB6|nr:storkhead-box protein 1-like [Falco rusticolus]
MPRRAERCLQIAPHSLAIVLGAAAGGRPGGGGGGGGAGPATELGRHRIGYEIFADFKRENMQHFWDRRATAAVAETFFLGWIDEQVLLVQGKEEHLEVLRQGWARRSLKPPSGFHIKCLALKKQTVHLQTKSPYAFCFSKPELFCVRHWWCSRVLHLNFLSSSPFVFPTETSFCISCT